MSGSTNNPETGKSYTLTCALTGVDVIKDLNPEYHFHFFKDGMLFCDVRSTFVYSFSPLKFSDAGTYACQVIATFTRGETVATINSTSLQLPLIFSGKLRAQNVPIHVMYSKKKYLNVITKMYSYIYP